LRLSVTLLGVPFFLPLPGVFAVPFGCGIS
jgi:hypothetical protein